MKANSFISGAPAAVGPYFSASFARVLWFLRWANSSRPETARWCHETSASKRDALDNITAVLKAEGLTFDHIVKTTIFLTDLADFQTVNEIYGSYFKQQPPARSTVQVSAPAKGARVEIEAIAMAENSAPSGGQSVGDTSGLI